MKTRIVALATFASILLPGNAGAADQVDEKEYTRIAAHVIATVEACTALGIIDPQVGILDDIEVGMMSFGATAEEVEEWESNVTARSSAAIQAVLKPEDADAVWLSCTKDIDDKRRKLAVILNGDSIGDSMIDSGATSTDDTTVSE